MARNLSIEVLRITLMFGIVLEHVMSYLGNRATASILDSCVDGFVFISGYYGIKFRVSKVLRLVMLAVGYSIALNLIDAVCGGNGWGIGVLKLRGWWFLWAYIVVMLLAPLMDYGNPDKRKFGIAAVPVLVLVFGWSYALKLPFLRDIVPSPTGFGPLTFLTLLGVYVFARLFRYCDLQHRIKGWVYALGGVGAVLLAARGEWWHNSLPMLFLAMIWFVVFSYLKVPDAIGRLIAWCSPSMLAIYMLHCNGTIDVYWKGFSDYLALDCGMPKMLSGLVVACVVFFCCLFVDMVRRLIVVPIMPLAERWFNEMDTKYNKLTTFIERWCTHV